MQEFFHLKAKAMAKKTNRIITVLFIAAAIVIGGLLAFSLYGKQQMSKIPGLSSDEIISYSTKGNKHAVITVGTIKNAQASYTVYGENGKELPQALHTYEIGSLSKTFTAAMICKASQENKIKLSNTIDVYLNLPNSSNYPTIEQLLTHTSGYKAYYFESPMISNFLSGKNDFYGITKDMVVDKIDRLSVPDKAHDFEYSNFGYAVLGLILENVYEQDYKSLLNQFAQKELGLANTQVSDGTGDLGSYWDWNDDDAYLPAGAITSNIEDMLLYAQMQLDQTVIFQECHKSCKNIDATSDENRIMGINMDEIGMAWIIDATNNIVWHNGGTGAYNSYLGFNVEKGTAVVVLSNLSPDYRIPATVLGPKILNEIS